MFQEYFNQRMDDKNFTAEDIERLTKVPLKNIIALKEGKFEQLPANVFVKGYLQKIAKILDIDFEEFWNMYLEEYNLRMPPKPDLLPSNRFESNKEITHHILKILRYIPIVAIIITAIGFILFQSKNLFGEPKLKIISPAFETIETSENPFVIEGEGQPHSYITINNKEIYLGDDGKFSEAINLREGLNEIIIESVNRTGKKKTIERKIYFNNPTQVSSTPTPIKTPSVSITPKILNSSPNSSLEINTPTPTLPIINY
ncbi:MAG: helix-turn-helix domain-containing protein [Patescibacteria group bacterium]|jgi:hypothetical protein|nr:helix-turn-helix domain-containing protein [Patescibacteria group bacterium]